MKKQVLLAVLCISMAMVGCGKAEEESAKTQTTQETQESTEGKKEKETKNEEKDKEAYYASLLTGETLSEDELSDIKDVLMIAENNIYLYYEFRTLDDVEWKYADHDDEDYEILAGALDGDTYQVVLQPKKYDYFNQSMNRVITFTKDGDKINPISNRFLWEENCNEEESFTIKLSQFDGDVRFVAIPALWGEDTNEKEHFRITENGYARVELESVCNRWEGSYHFTSILAVDTLDYNFDGEDDIIVLGKTDKGYELELYEASADYEYYGNGKWAFYNGSDELSESLEKEIGGFSEPEDVFPAVKKILRGKALDGTFADYQEAYRQLVDNCERECAGEYRYNLVYLDADDVPELVVDVPGYNLTTYTMADGMPSCLMPGWGYGAMGHSGYEYAEKTGWIRDHDQDYAGALHYTTFLKQDEKGHFSEGYTREDYFFDDADGDGVPSQEELEHSFEEGVGHTEYYVRQPEFHQDDSVKDIVEELDSYDYEVLGGEYTYPEIQKMLDAPQYEVERILEHGKEITLNGQSYKLITELGDGKVSLNVECAHGSMKREAKGQNYLLYYVHRGDEKGYLYFCAMSPEGGNSLYIYDLQRENPEKPVLYEERDIADYAFAGDMTDANAFEMAHTCDLWGQALVKNTFYIGPNGNPVTTDRFSYYLKGSVKTKVAMEAKQSDKLDVTYIYDDVTIPAGTVLHFYRTNGRDEIDFLTDDKKLVGFHVEKEGSNLLLEYQYSPDDFEYILD